MRVLLLATGVGCALPAGTSPRRPGTPLAQLSPWKCRLVLDWDQRMGGRDVEWETFRDD